MLRHKDSKDYSEKLLNNILKIYKIVRLLIIFFDEIVTIILYIINIIFHSILLFYNIFLIIKII